ncbi:hypothetical protein A51_021239, partial [Vibrio cholerae MZO-3]
RYIADSLPPDNSSTIPPCATNARLRGWQRITLNSNTPTVTTAAHWDWKRHALTVPLEAFVMLKLQHFTFEPNQE